MPPIWWPGIISNERLWQRTCHMPVVQEIRQRHWRWFFTLSASQAYNESNIGLLQWHIKYLKCRRIHSSSCAGNDNGCQLPQVPFIPLKIHSAEDPFDTPVSIWDSRHATYGWFPDGIELLGDSEKEIQQLTERNLCSAAECVQHSASNQR